MRAIGILALTSSVLGCNGDKDGGDLILADENNYTYEGLLTIDRIEVAPQSDLTVDWSAIDTDIRGRPLDPTTVQEAAVLGVGGAVDEVITLIEENELDVTEEAYLYDNAGSTSAPFSDFEILSNPFDYDIVEEDPDKTWLVSLLNVDGGTTDLLMSTVIVPTEGSTVTDIVLDNDSARLDVTVDFHSAPALSTTADGGPYVLDWTDVTVDVFGHTFSALLADELIVGRYATEDIAQIEAGFLQLDTNAAELYQVNVRGLTAMDLAEAVDENDTPFPGFTTDGTWLVALLCSECITPVPLFISIVEVE